jgi:predicted transcriptional regulator
MNCPHCLGSGKAVDAIKKGQEMKALRIASGVSVREIAWRLKVSSAYVCDVEFGRRGVKPWSTWEPIYRALKANDTKKK